MEIKAFKSEHTGEIFETLEQYIQHIKEHAEATIQKSFLAQKKEEYHQLIHQPRMTSETIDQFIQKFFKTINELNPGKLISIDMKNLNFGHIHELAHPIGYPMDDNHRRYLGWRCRLKFTTGDWDDESWALINKFPGFHLGTGYGSYKNSRNGEYFYSSYMYLLDFPAINSQYSEYIDLQNSAGKWKETVDRVIANKIDESTYTLKNKQKMMLHELDIINEQISFTTSAIKDKMLKSCPFKNQEKLNFLQNQFNNFLK